MSTYLPEAVEWVSKHKTYSERGRWVCKKPYGYYGVLRGDSPGALIAAMDRFMKEHHAYTWRKRIGV